MKKQIFLFAAILLCTGVARADAVLSGQLSGVFSVSATKQVNFSQGALQYQANSSTWRFAEHQYDFVGNASYGNVYVESTKSDNSLISASYTGWIDLFGWGTGNNPTLTNTEDTSYATYNDWGTAVSAQLGTGWSVLTSDEWTYLMQTRDNAASRKARATVCNNVGTIILPDNWTLPTGLTMTYNVTDYSTNTYDAEQWTALENAGAVFLPAAGYRNGTSVSYAGTPYIFAYYWTTTTDNADRADAVQLHSDTYLLYSSYRHNGYAVRLVKIKYPDASITTTPSAIENIVYDGSAHALINAGEASGGTMQYKLGEGSWSASVPTATDAGDYTVYYKVVGDATHSDFTPANNSISVTIKMQISANEDPQNPGTYYSTFYDSSRRYVLPAGAEAYVATLSGDALIMTKIAEEDDVLPEDNAVILKSGIPSYVLTPSNEQPVSFTAANSLRGVDEQTALASLNLTRATCYVLSGTAEYGVGFYQCNSDFLKPHKAYVSYQGSGQQNAPRRMRFVFNDNQSATGIVNMDQEPIVNSRKLIKNGQLVIIRNGMEYNAAGQLVK